MKRTVLLLCTLLVLCWAAPEAQAQGRGGGGRRGGRGAGTERTERSSQADRAKETRVKRAQEQTEETANETAQAKGRAAEKRQTQQTRADTSARGKEAQSSGNDKQKGPGEVAKAKGKDHQQQLRAFERQRERNQAKHMERQARLARIRELAVQKGDAEMIARVDKLMAKEQQVHERKQNRLQQQRRTLMGSPSDQPEITTDAPKGKDRAQQGAEKNRDQERQVKTEREKEPEEDGQSQD